MGSPCGDLTRLSWGELNREIEMVTFSLMCLLDAVRTEPIVAAIASMERRYDELSGEREIRSFVFDPSGLRRG